MSESLSNPNLRKANFNKIIAAGGDIANYPEFGTASSLVDQLMLLNGNIVRSSRLDFNLQPEEGSILLQDGDPIAQSGYLLDTIGGSLVLRVIVDTYRGEGSGFGSALVALADRTVTSLVSQYNPVDGIYAVAEDFATNREEGINRVNWSTNIFSQLGYRPDFAMMKQIGLNYKSRPMLIKRLG